MITWNVKVRVNGGLHARPAALLVSRANRYASSITIIKDGKRANGKSLLNVMALGARNGDEVTLVIEGEDEAEAAADLRALFESNFAM